MLRKGNGPDRTHALASVATRRRSDSEQKKFVRRRSAGPSAKKGGCGPQTQRVFHHPVEAAPRYQAGPSTLLRAAEPNDDAPDDSHSSRRGMRLILKTLFKVSLRATRPAGGNADRVDYGESSTVDDVSDRKTPTGLDRRLLFTSRWSFPVRTSLRPSSPT